MSERPKDVNFERAAAGRVKHVVNFTSSIFVEIGKMISVADERGAFHVDGMFQTAVPAEIRMGVRFVFLHFLLGFVHTTRGRRRR